MIIRQDTDDLIAFLNELVKIDPVAIRALIEARVPCNAHLANHPTVQVSAHGPGNSHYMAIPPGEYRVGILGILNGYAGTIDDGHFAGYGPIAAIVEDDGSISGFRRTEMS